jgi:hypothetical protein
MPWRLSRLPTRIPREDFHSAYFRHLFDVLVLDPELEDAGDDLELAVHRAGGDVLAHPQDFVSFNATHIDVAGQSGEEGFQIRTYRDHPFAYRLRGEVGLRPAEVFIAKEIERDFLRRDILALLQSRLKFPKVLQGRLFRIPRDLTIFLAPEGHAHVPAGFTVPSDLFVDAAHA